MSDYGLLDPEERTVHLEKTPDEARTLSFRWASALAGETISSYSFELPDGLTSEADAQSGTVTTIRVAGGDACRIYRVIGKITTSGSQDFEVVRRVRVKEG